MGWKRSEGGWKGGWKGGWPPRPSWIEGVAATLGEDASLVASRRAFHSPGLWRAGGFYPDDDLRRFPTLRRFASYR
jgi:hypothetical protein